MEQHEILSALKQKRIDTRMSQSALAALVGITYEHVGRIERGAVSPSLDLVCKMARALDCELTIKICKK